METKNVQRKPESRRRKVYYQSAPRKRKAWCRHPVIHIGGKYLLDYGFKIGEELEISFEQGKIVIKKLPPVNSP